MNDPRYATPMSPPNTPYPAPHPPAQPAQSASTLELLLGVMHNQSTTQLVERVWNEITPEQKQQLADRLVQLLESTIDKEFVERGDRIWDHGLGHQLVSQLVKIWEPMVQRVAMARSASIETRLTEYAIEKWDDRVKPLATRLFDEALKEVQERLVRTFTDMRGGAFGTRDRGY